MAWSSRGGCSVATAKTNPPDPIIISLTISGPRGLGSNHNDVFYDSIIIIIVAVVVY